MIIFYLIFPLRGVFIIAILQKFTLCHLFLGFQFAELLQTFTEIESYKHKYILSVEITVFIVEIFFTLVFLEIIELKFCGLFLNKYNSIII